MQGHSLLFLLVCVLIHLTVFSSFFVCLFVGFLGFVLGILGVFCLTDTAFVWGVAASFPKVHVPRVPKTGYVTWTHSKCGGVPFL